MHWDAPTCSDCLPHRNGGVALCLVHLQAVVAIRIATAHLAWWRNECEAGRQSPMLKELIRDMETAMAHPAPRPKEVAAQ